jgi:hypothetical protein
MAGKTTYDDKIRAHIREVVQRQQVQDVLHFTRLENLGHILEHGLRSRADLSSEKFEFDVWVSDAELPSGDDTAVSVSISYFYPKMFEAKRRTAGGSAWAILVLRSELLWELHCLFYENSVLSNAVKRQNRKRYGGYALDRLFEDCSTGGARGGTGYRVAHGLLPDCPTWPDSEVQVMEPIHPGYIRGVWIETLDHEAFARKTLDAAGRDECATLVQPFEPRISAGRHRWG